MLGCFADGKREFCRFCGEGDYADIPCPPSSCRFVAEPATPYYWDSSCEMGKLGCWADGVHSKCRYCGEQPYTSIDCPSVVAVPAATACHFGNVPQTPFFWDPTCHVGMKGCLADGRSIGCRFCGDGDFSDVECPSDKEKRCTFANEPVVPYYWEPSCTAGMLGCMADGVHFQCRFCAARPFQDIPCPGTISVALASCSFPNEPATPYFWDESCELGALGCWADGLHKECRFCEKGVYHNITCGSATGRTGFLGSNPRGASISKDIDLMREAVNETDVASMAFRSAEPPCVRSIVASSLFALLAICH